MELAVGFYISNPALRHLLHRLNITHDHLPCSLYNFTRINNTFLFIHSSQPFVGLLMGRSIGNRDLDDIDNVLRRVCESLNLVFQDRWNLVFTNTENFNLNDYRLQINEDLPVVGVETENAIEEEDV